MSGILDVLLPYRPFILAVLIAALLYFIYYRLLANRLFGADKAIADFTGSSIRSLGSGVPHSAGESSTRTTGDWQHKVRLAYAQYNLNVAGWENVAVALTIVALSLLIVFLLNTFGLPKIVLWGAPVLAIVLVQGKVTSAWTKMAQEMEKDVPTMLIRFSGMIQAAPNVIQALNEISRSLDPSRPLQVWLERLVDAIQERGAEGLKAMEEEAKAISPALLLSVIQIRRMWETGGIGQIASLQMVADHLSELIATRSKAHAKAGRGWGLAKIIIASAIITLYSILNNPSSRDIFLSNSFTQIGLVAMLIWGGLGWAYINDMLRKATE
jgi:hypothetical protein